MKADAFELHRPALLGLAWRMTGSLSTAEDVVQEAWLRFDRTPDVRAPRPWLMQVVSRLCLDTLGRASTRREVPAGEQLPEPVATPMDLEQADTVSLAFLVVLQTLSPAERVVFLLHEVFELTHPQIGQILDRDAANCRQLLRRARARVREETPRFSAPPEEHATLLGAFVDACRTGDLERLVSLLAEDATLMAAGDGAARFGRLRQLRRPLVGGPRVAQFLLAGVTHGPTNLSLTTESINGQPALVARMQDAGAWVLQIAAGGGQIHRVFVIPHSPRDL